MTIVSIADIAVLLIGCGVLCVWFLLYLRGRKNSWMFEKLDDKDYPVKDLYFIGYEVVQMMNMQFKYNKDRRLRKELAVL